METRKGGSNLNTAILADTTQSGNDGEPEICFLKPVASDGTDVWTLIRDVGTLDLNSAYCYMMMCDYYADTCVLARDREGQALGFVSAFIPPQKPDTLFVWQVGVARKARGQGLGASLLREAVSRGACEDVCYLEATISPDNEASKALFHRFAHEHGAEVIEAGGYRSGWFPEGAHEDEVLYRIGPLSMLS